MNLRKRGDPFGLSELNLQGHMEINGNREAVVEGCSGVLEYNSQVVRVVTRGKTVRFTGRGLTIRSLTADALVVAGFITSIEFLN